MIATPYRRRAFYYETDQMGIVHHANYIRWFEEARLDYMRQAGLVYSKMENAGILMPVTEVQSKFCAPIRFDETFEVVTRFARFNGVRAWYTYEIRSADTGALAVTGSSCHCFLDAATRRPINLKKQYPDFYETASAILRASQTEKEQA